MNNDLYDGVSARRRITPYTGDIGTPAGLYNHDASASTNIIMKITIGRTSNATDFGDLQYVSSYGTSASNGTSDKGIKDCRQHNTTNCIQEWTISTGSDAANWGGISAPYDGRSSKASTSNGTDDRGIFAGGQESVYQNEIHYCTISSGSSTTDFGDLLDNKRSLGATSNGTSDRGIFGGGHADPQTDRIEYITITSTGNGTDNDNLTAARYNVTAISNDTDDRGVWCGGQTNDPTFYNIIDYRTISSSGNATDFGDLSNNKVNCGSLSNGIDERGVIYGGDTGSKINVIEYITIDTTGNVSDFGDLLFSTSLYDTHGASNAAQ